MSALILAIPSKGRLQADSEALFARAGLTIVPGGNTSALVNVQVTACARPFAAAPVTDTGKVRFTLVPVPVAIVVPAPFTQA